MKETSYLRVICIDLCSLCAPTKIITKQLKMNYRISSQNKKLTAFLAAYQSSRCGKDPGDQSASKCLPASEPCCI